MRVELWDAHGPWRTVVVLDLHREIVVPVMPDRLRFWDAPPQVWLDETTIVTRTFRPEALPDGTVIYREVASA